MEKKRRRDEMHLTEYFREHDYEELGKKIQEFFMSCDEVESPLEIVSVNITYASHCHEALIIYKRISFPECTDGEFDEYQANLAALSK